MTIVEHLYEILKRHPVGRARLQLTTYRPTGGGGGTAEGESEIVVLHDEEIGDAQELRTNLGKVLKASRRHHQQQAETGKQIGNILRHITESEAHDLMEPMTEQEERRINDIVGEAAERDSRCDG